MKTFLKATALTAAVAFAPAAMADDMGLYGDIGVGSFTADEGDFDVNVTTLQGHIGYNFNDYFGVEGELAFGIDEDEVNSSDVGLLPNIKVDVALNHQIGVFGVLSTANTNGFEVFGRLGYVTAEIEANAQGVSAEADGDGVAFGIGAKYYFDGVNGVRADLSTIEGEATNISIGYARKF